MVAAQPLPPGEIVSSADQRVIMRGVPWSHYQALLELRGESAVPRLTFLGGALEIMNPSRSHEGIKSTIGCLVEVYAEERGIAFTTIGSWTLKSEEAERGAEPDECYIFGEDLEKPVPELAIEVIWTSGGLDKLEVYRPLQVGEVWMWRRGSIEVYVLEGGAYQRRERSACLPGLDLALLATFAEVRPTSLVRSRFRAAVRAAP